MGDRCDDGRIVPRDVREGTATGRTRARSSACRSGVAPLAVYASVFGSFVLVLAFSGDMGPGARGTVRALAWLGLFVAAYVGSVAKRRSRLEKPTTLSLAALGFLVVPEEAGTVHPHVPPNRSAQVPYRSAQVPWTYGGVASKPNEAISNEAMSNGLVTWNTSSTSGTWSFSTRATPEGSVEWSGPDRP